MKLPAKVFKNLLAKAVPITGSPAGMITHAIAFKAEQKRAGPY